MSARDRGWMWLMALSCVAVFLGAWSGDGWRVGPGWLADLTGFQALWGLGAFATGLVGGTTRAGAGAGAFFGGLAIASYYLDMWLVQGAHSAVAQLTKSGGAFWCVGAVVGGAALGWAGALARRPASGRRWDPAPLAWAGVAGLLLLEAAYDRLVHRNIVTDTSLTVAAVLVVVVAVAVAAIGVRRTGARAFGIAAAEVALVAPLVALALLAAERVFAYTTL